MNKINLAILIIISIITTQDCYAQKVHTQQGIKILIHIVI